MTPANSLKLAPSLASPWFRGFQLPEIGSLLPLPAGSPELNPAEQVWQQLRDRHLANRCYDGYEQIVDACCGLECLHANPWRHPFPVLAQLGNAAFGFGNFMTRDWY